MPEIATALKTARRIPPRCGRRPSRSSAARTSARARCSIGLIGQRLAIVDEEPGVTRDRLYALAEWRGRAFTLVDTAGIDPDVIATTRLRPKTRRQAEAAARGRRRRRVRRRCGGGTQSARRRGRRRSCAGRGDPVVLVANKAESPSARDSAFTANSRGSGSAKPIAVSALHGEGTGDLLDAIVERLPPRKRSPRDAGGGAGRRDHRPAQRRKELAAQRAAGRRARARLGRAGNDARCHRLASFPIATGRFV